MRYISTRGEAPPLGFEDVLLTGLASDGGLYVPEHWPSLELDEITALQSRPYWEVAARIMQPFVGEDVPREELREIALETYRNFGHPAVAPLVQIGHDQWVLELFHGPTLAFKDFAMQMLGRLMDRALKRRGERTTIVVATSGDTGGAAVEAFRGRDAIDIVVLHPHGRVSDVQRRQMTTVADANVHNLAIEGTFDDCQTIVKRIFNDRSPNAKTSLSAVNSINWARIMAQTVYYFTAALSLGAPRRGLTFSVPTGNFGDIFAGYVARKMGLPIDRLVIATNVNDILARALASGHYEPKTVMATSSPSMDIQISSNFERLLFEASGRNPASVRSMMQDLHEQGSFSISPEPLGRMRTTFAAHAIHEPEVAETLKDLNESAGYLADPHTAIGVAAARREGKPFPGAIITLATAHPAKFPDAVESATGREPVLPAHIAERLQGEERYDVMPNDYGHVAAFVRDKSGAVLESLA